jgi:hypothetical protein
MSTKIENLHQKPTDYLMDAENRFQQEVGSHSAQENYIDQVNVPEVDKSTPRTRRGRVAKAFVTLGIGAALIQANGGPEQIVKGAKTLPAHMGYVFNGPEQSQK